MALKLHSCNECRCGVSIGGASIGCSCVVVNTKLNPVQKVVVLSLLTPNYEAGVVDVMADDARVGDDVKDFHFSLVRPAVVELQ